MVVPGATQTLSTFCLSRTQNFMIVNIIKKRRISICSILQPWESLSGYQYSHHWWCAGAALHLSSFWDWVEGEHLCTSSGSFMDFNRRWGHCCNQLASLWGTFVSHACCCLQLNCTWSEAVATAQNMQEKEKHKTILQYLRSFQNQINSFIRYAACDFR